MGQITMATERYIEGFRRGKEVIDLPPEIALLLKGFFLNPKSNPEANPPTFFPLK